MTSTIMHPPLSWQRSPQQPLLASTRSSASSYNSVSASSTAVSSSDSTDRAGPDKRQAKSRPDLVIRRGIFLALWALPHMLIVLRFGVFGRKSLFKRANDVLVNAILFDVAAILVLMSPTFIGLLQKTFLPRYISFERNVAAHTTAAEYLLIWSLIHMGLYYKRYIDQSYPQVKNGRTVPGKSLSHNLFYKATGWTGHFLLIFYIVIVISAVGSIRRRFYERFYWLHHLFVFYILFLFIHHRNKETYKYLYGPMALYCTDRAYRSMRSAFGRSPIQCVVQHPSGVVELKLAKMITGIRPGQYVKVCCPSISPYQWHPITISGASGDSCLTLHFRVEGSWTRRLAERVNCDFGKDPRKSTAQKTFVVGSDDTLCESGAAGAAAVGGLRIVDLPQIFVDGPYSASSQNFRLHNANILIAAGIGVTPAASVIASLKSEIGHGKGSTVAKRVYLFWAFRDIGAIEWFKDLFVSLEDNGLSSAIRVCMYYTGKELHGLSALPAEDRDVFGDKHIHTTSGLRVYLGRPDINTIFQYVGKSHPDENVGVFMCGPKLMIRDTQKLAVKWDKILHETCNTQLDFHAESFF